LQATGDISFLQEAGFGQIFEIRFRSGDDVHVALFDFGQQQLGVHFLGTFVIREQEI